MCVSRGDTLAKYNQMMNHYHEAKSDTICRIQANSIHIETESAISSDSDFHITGKITKYILMCIQARIRADVLLVNFNINRFSFYDKDNFLVTQ